MGFYRVTPTCLVVTFGDSSNPFQFEQSNVAFISVDLLDLLFQCAIISLQSGGAFDV